MRNRYNVDTLTSLVNQEIVKIGGKNLQIYESVIYRENFKVSPFRKIFDEKKLNKDGNKKMIRMKLCNF